MGALAPAGAVLLGKPSPQCSVRHHSFRMTTSFVSSTPFRKTFFSTYTTLCAPIHLHKCTKFYFPLWLFLSSAANKSVETSSQHRPAAFHRLGFFLNSQLTGNSFPEKKSFPEHKETTKSKGFLWLYLSVRN